MKTNTLSLLFVLLLSYFLLSHTAQAVVPAPDGGYPNFNTAEGTNALLTLTTGAANTAIGWSSLKSVATGGFNTSVGAGTLLFNTADSNTAIGTAALLFNTTGTFNTAVGSGALQNNASGSNNIGLGVSAGNNITGNNNIDIGNNGVVSDNGVIRIGDAQFATYIAGIAGREADCNSPFIAVDPDGKIGIPRCMSGAPLSFNDLREQQATITELKSIVAQQQKAMEMLTAQLKEQAAQIQKVSAQLETSKPAPQVVKNP